MGVGQHRCCCGGCGEFGGFGRSVGCRFGGSRERVDHRERENGKQIRDRVIERERSKKLGGGGCVEGGWFGEGSKEVSYDKKRFLNVKRKVCFEVASRDIGG